MRTSLALTGPGQFRPAFGTFPHISVAHVPAITFFLARRRAALAGYCELRRVPARGLGTHLWSPNYLARGFVPYTREEYEVDLVT